MGNGFGSFILPPIDPSGGGTDPLVGTTPPGNTPAADPTFTLFSEITNVPVSAQTDLLTFNIPASGINHLLFIEFGGCNIAEYVLEIDAVVEAKRFLSWGDDIGGDTWNFKAPNGGGKLLPAGKILKVKVTNNSGELTLGDFWARLCYMTIN